jgi:hypothetical protein
MQPEPPLLFDSSDGSPNYLHTPIPANPVVDPDSATLVAMADFGNHPPMAGFFGWAVPIYNTRNSDPVYFPVLDHASDWGCSVGPGGIHIPDFAAIEPAAFPNGDNWIVTVNLDTSEVIGIWAANKSTGQWTGGCAGTFPLHGNGFNPTAGVGTGSGSQMGAGEIMISELERGSIEHALYVSSTMSSTTFRAPAFKSDGHCAGGGAAGCWEMGLRAQLDPAIDCNGLGATDGERMVCRAMQVYGAYVLDSGGAGPMSGFPFEGDDMADPNRRPWLTPGDGTRGTRGCAPVGPTCGVYAHYGLLGYPDDFSHVPWTGLRVLAHWNGQ